MWPYMDCEKDCPRGARRRWRAFKFLGKALPGPFCFNRVYFFSQRIVFLIQARTNDPREFKTFKSSTDRFAVLQTRRALLSSLLCNQHTHTNFCSTFSFEFLRKEKDSLIAYHFTTYRLESNHFNCKLSRSANLSAISQRDFFTLCIFQNNQNVLAS